MVILKKHIVYPISFILVCFRVLSATPEGWGIDACLSVHCDEKTRNEYLRLLRSTGISVLREREIPLTKKGEPNSAIVSALTEIRDSGFKVIAFAGRVDSRGPSNGMDELETDLRRVFNYGQLLGRGTYGRVDAWEMVGEADVGYCRDLPDRVIAYEKALYLGLKAGSPHTPVVMGALALPPGPWLSRAIENGMLNYTDAYNIHYYGSAEDFGPTLGMHERILNSPDCSSVGKLPIWVTECGIQTVGSNNFANVDRRKIQAEFYSVTARAAYRDPRVSLFMPFVLVNSGDPLAISINPHRVWPAWNTYSESTIRYRWNKAIRSIESHSANELVLQWLPLGNSAIPHKVSGSYRFVDRARMYGRLNLYNFGRSSASGRLKFVADSKLMLTCSSDKISILPGSSASVDCSFEAVNPDRYFLSNVKMVFTDVDKKES